MKGLVATAVGKGFIMKLRPVSEDMALIAQGVERILGKGGWKTDPLSTTHFVSIISHLVEMMRRSGYDPETTVQLVMRALHEARYLASDKEVDF